MAYLFMDENHPESMEYHSNYIYFNADEPGVFGRMMSKCNELKQNGLRTENKYSIIEEELSAPNICDA